MLIHSDTDSPASFFHLQGTLLFYYAYFDNSRIIHLKILNLITSAKSLLPCNVIYLQIPGIRTLTSSGGYYSACHLVIWPESGNKSPLSLVILWKPLILQTPATWLHSGEEFPINNHISHFPTSGLCGLRV